MIIGNVLAVVDWRPLEEVSGALLIDYVDEFYSSMIGIDSLILNTRDMADQITFPTR